MKLYGDTGSLESVLTANGDFHPVIFIEPKRTRVASVNLSISNPLFTQDVYSERQTFEAFLNDTAAKYKAQYLIGGYAEHRQMYRRSVLFDKDVTVEDDSAEPRSLHLGVDVWGRAGTPVYAPLGGMIHSLAFNNNFGDYGATIIIQHQLEGVNFHTLYGHLALADLTGKRVGQYISRGEEFAHFGPWEENGNWPPHLHFQVIADMGSFEGDYPGVCKMSERAKYLENCPDPELILNLKQHLV